MPQQERRIGHERRREAISHEAIFEKLLEHEERIVSNSERLVGIEKDVHVVREQMKPINDGMKSMVFLFKVAIALGALSAAILGVIELTVLSKDL